MTPTFLQTVSHYRNDFSYLHSRPHTLLDLFCLLLQQNVNIFELKQQAVIHWIKFVGEYLTTNL